MKAYCIDRPVGGAFFRMPFGFGWEAERCKGTVGGRSLTGSTESIEEVFQEMDKLSEAKRSQAILGNGPGIS